MRSRDTIFPHDDGSEVFRFSLRRLALIVTFIVVAIGFLAIMMRAGAEHARLSELRSRIPLNFSIVAHAMTRRGGEYGHSLSSETLPWPPNSPTDDSGQPLNNWRVHIADELGKTVPDSGLGPRVNPSERWDSSANQLASHVFGPAFCAIPPYQTTIVFGITGPHCAFDETLVTQYSELPPSVIVAMEVADSKTYWMKPGDYDVSELLAKSGELGAAVKSHLPDRVHVVFADGEVWALSSDLPMKSLHPFLTIEGATSASREKALGPYRIPTVLD